jgi:hypothetical protein
MYVHERLVIGMQSQSGLTEFAGQLAMGNRTPKLSGKVRHVVDGVAAKEL